METSYRDIKSKTINWCKSLKDTNIYNEKDYENCLNSFVELEEGELPPVMEKPKSGNEYSFSLYGRKNNYTQKRLYDSKTNKVMISTVNNMFLLPSEDGSISIVNKESINDQRDIEWRIIPYNQDSILLKSKFELYLTADQNKKVTSDRADEGPYSLWKIQKSGNFTHIVSQEFKGEKLTATSPLSLTDGYMKTQNWNLKEVLVDDEQVIQKFDTAELHTFKDSLLIRLEEVLKEKYDLLIEFKNINVIMKLLTDKYNLINGKVDKNIFFINKEFIKESASNRLYATKKYGSEYKLDNEIQKQKYNPNVNSETEDSNINTLSDKILNKDSRLNKYVKELKKYSSELTLDGTRNFRPFTSEEKTLQNLNVKNSAEAMMQEIIADKKIVEERYKEVISQYNSLDNETTEWINKLKDKIKDREFTIKQNNIKMGRQSALLKELEGENKDLDIKVEKLEDLEDTSTINRKIKEEKKRQIKYYYYIYLVIILLCIGLIIYLSIRLTNQVVKKF